MPSGTLPQHTDRSFTPTGKDANLLAAQHETGYERREEETMTAPSLGIVADDLSGAGLYYSAVSRVAPMQARP